MTSVAELTKQFKKTYGDSAAMIGGKMNNIQRIPTGMFAFDLASGGGFPRGRASIVYGPESSGKTNKAFKAIASHQRLWPDYKCAFIGIEGFDGPWAAKLGVQVDDLLVIRPDFAEQVVDITEGLLHADDCGLVVIDSLAAMIGAKEAEVEAEKAAVGGASVLVGKLVRKSTLAFNKADKEGRCPSLIYINQIRQKIGVMYGDPETTPGGGAPNFQAALKVRVYGKNVVDNAISKTMPIAKETTFVIKKWKVPIFAANGVYTMVTVPHGGFECGDTDDFNTVTQYAKQYGLLSKQPKAGWKLGDLDFGTLGEIKELSRQDPTWWLQVKDQLMARVMGTGNVLAPVEDEADADE